MVDAAFAVTALPVAGFAFTFELAAAGLAGALPFFDAAAGFAVALRGAALLLLLADLLFDDVFGTLNDPLVR
ncbi:MAG: hypothetical protein AB7K09_26480 [Planctomycetota bacterium]